MAFGVKVVGQHTNFYNLAKAQLLRIKTAFFPLQNTVLFNAFSVNKWTNIIQCDIQHNYDYIVKANLYFIVMKYALIYVLCMTPNAFDIRKSHKKNFSGNNQKNRKT